MLANISKESELSKSPTNIAVASQYALQTVGSHLLSVSLSSAGKSSWTRLYAWSISSAIQYFIMSSDSCISSMAFHETII